MTTSIQPRHSLILITILAAMCTGEGLTGCSAAASDSEFTNTGKAGSTSSAGKAGGGGSAGGDDSTEPMDLSGAGGRTPLTVDREVNNGGAAGQGGQTTPGKLTAVIRDFKVYDAEDPTTNPDFENVPTTDPDGNRSRVAGGPWDDREIVTDTLGDDNTPQYLNTTGSTWTTHGPDAFHAWFHDVEGTNIRVEYPISLSNDGSGNYGFDSEKSGTSLGTGRNATKMFFPIDDGTPYATAFGNQGQSHNYSFTLELHTVFTYHGGETFNFRGDDDVFVYIDKRLVINLGGIHAREMADVEIDTLGLEVGKQYPLDFFYAERHVTESNLLITTTLELVTAPVVQ